MDRQSAISKRALVAWDKISLPKTAGGLGIVDLGVWNKAAICKLYWNLANKKDTAWIKWVHEYYIKTNNLQDMHIPRQCSWIIRKIMGAREYLRSLDDGQEWIHRSSFSIKEVYKALRGDVQQVPWNKMVCQNLAPPKCVFIVWLLLQRGLATCEFLQRIGVIVDPKCCFCEHDPESLDHLFFGCEVTGKVWSLVAEWCGLESRRKEWNREQIYLLTQCTTNSGKQHMYRCAISVVVYLIWKERNCRRMQGGKTSSEGLVHQCKLMLAWCGQRYRKIGRRMAL